MRRRMLAPILQQLIGFEQRECFDIAPRPSSRSNDVAEEIGPVGDPAYLAAGSDSPGDPSATTGDTDRFSPEASSTRSSTSGKLFKSSSSSSSSIATSGCTLLIEAWITCTSPSMELKPVATRCSTPSNAGSRRRRSPRVRGDTLNSRSRSNTETICTFTI